MPPHGGEDIEESLERCRAAGDEWGITSALKGLGRAALWLGDFEPAAALLAESLTNFRDQGAKPEVPWYTTIKCGSGFAISR